MPTELRVEAILIHVEADTHNHIFRRGIGPFAPGGLEQNAAALSSANKNVVRPLDGCAQERHVFYGLGDGERTQQREDPDAPRLDSRSQENREKEVAGCIRRPSSSKSSATCRLKVRGHASTLRRIVFGELAQDIVRRDNLSKVRVRQAETPILAHNEIVRRRSDAISTRCRQESQLRWIRTKTGWFSYPDDMKERILLLVVAASVACVPSEATGQEGRSAKLNAEFHRAQAAWASGGSLLEAKARLDNVIEALPRDDEALKLRAKVLLALQRNSAAYDDAVRAVEADSGDSEAHQILSQAARLVGDTTAAVRALRRAAETIGDDAPAHVRLSYEAMALGLTEEAESLARVAVVLDPQGAAARYQLARALAVAGKTKDATTVLAKGIQESILTHTAIESDSVLIATGVARLLKGELE